MTNQSQKKKPIKIQWEGNILSSSEDSPVVLKNEKIPTAQKVSNPKRIIGRVFLRSEKKGRGGSPVSILYKFSDPEAKNKESLKQLCSELKTKLACGGNVENEEIILMMRDTEKLKSVLAESFGLKV